jgi:hypothetical protein
MGRNYSRKLSPNTADLPLIWDSENSDWRLASLASIVNLLKESVDYAPDPVIQPEATFVSEDPVLELGQLGIASDKGYFKIGNGTSTWSALTKDYRSSVNDADWVEGVATNSWVGTPYYIKRSGMVTVTGSVDGTGASDNVSAVLPAGYRPNRTIYFAVNGFTASGPTEESGRGEINSSGEIILYGRQEQITYTVTFPYIAS